MNFNFKKAKENELENMEYLLFTSVYQQAHDIEKLLADKTDGKLAEIKKQMEPLLEITEENIKGKVSKEQKEARVKAFHSLQGLDFTRNKLVIAKSDLNKQIAERARTIKGYVDMIAFVKGFDGDIPKLPFLEIEGTKYQTNELGGFVKDEEGVRALYLEPKNEQGNISKKG